MTQQPHEALPVFQDWMQFLEWLLPTTTKFPKRVRLTFANRIENLALDIAEDLIEACYSPQKKIVLQQISRQLEKLRLLLRLAQRLLYLSYSQYEYAMRCLAVIGKQIGGWMKKK
jgi:hypothetical protein